MIISIHKYSDGNFQLIIPQGDDSIDLGNKVSKEEVIDTISKLLDMVK